VRIWRISEFADLSGDGGKYYPGRWNIRGTPIVYCADHPSTALLEILVHLNPNRMPQNYRLIEVNLSEGLAVTAPELRHGWEVDEGYTQLVGTEFIAESRNALMRVPSVIMPQAFNFLINPEHADSAKMSVGKTWRYPFDSRLLT
jgi:RES domain-containing protein